MKEVKLNLVQLIVIIFGVIVITSLVVVEIVKYYGNNEITEEEISSYTEEGKSIVEEENQNEIFNKVGREVYLWEPHTIEIGSASQVKPYAIGTKEDGMVFYINTFQYIEDESILPLNYKVYDSEDNVICNMESDTSKRLIETNGLGLGSDDILYLNGYNKEKDILKLEIYDKNSNLLETTNINFEFKKFETKADDKFIQLSEDEIKSFLGMVAGLRDDVEKNIENDMKISIAISLLSMQEKSEAMMISHDIGGYEAEMPSYPVELVNKTVEALFGNTIENFEDDANWMIVEENGIQYYSISSPGDGESGAVVYDIIDAQYANGIYQMTYEFHWNTEDLPLDLDNYIVNKYRKTVEFSITDNEYSKYKLISYEDSKEVE